MAGVSLKGRSKISGGLASKGQAQVLSGALKIRFVPRGTIRRGSGSARLRNGIPSKGELQIIRGAVRVRFA